MCSVCSDFCLPATEVYQIFVTVLSKFCVFFCVPKFEFQNQFFEIPVRPSRRQVQWPVYLSVTRGCPLNGIHGRYWRPFFFSSNDF